MYRSTEKRHEKLILWGFPESGYSGKIRSYLIKKGIAFEEHFPNEARFTEEILALVGYRVAPILELPDGLLLQDSTTTLLHLEHAYPRPSLTPHTPIQRVIAWMLNFFGSDGFGKLGMHYRWSYLEENRAFIEKMFLYWTSARASLEQRRNQAREMMQLLTTRTAHFGVTRESGPAIESSWFTCLDILDRHLAAHPYLLGGKPSVGDCGLMSIFHAHLARDPVPSVIMKTRAPNVFRWTERMNQPGFFDGEFPYTETDYPPDDTLPDSLLPFLQYLISDCGTEMKVTLAAFNRWLGENPGLASGDVLGCCLEGSPHPAETPFPSFASIEYSYGGVQIKRHGFVNTAYQLQQLQEIIDALGTIERDRLKRMMGEFDGAWLLDARPARRIAYRHYNYVLA